MNNRSRLLWRDSTGHWALAGGLLLNYNQGNIAN